MLAGYLSEAVLEEENIKAYKLCVVSKLQYRE